MKSGEKDAVEQQSQSDSSSAKSQTMDQKTKRKSKATVNAQVEVNDDAKISEDGQETSSGTPEGTDKAEEVAAQADSPLITGEWSSEHTYVCCACGYVEDDLAEIMDHKWAKHTGVLCAHTMMQDKPGSPAQFCHQYRPPEQRWALAQVDAPAVSKSTSQRKSAAKAKTSAAKKSVEAPAQVTHRCTKCAEDFETATELHMHVVVCGGLAKLYTSKFIKKSKKNNPK